MTQYKELASEHGKTSDYLYPNLEEDTVNVCLAQLGSGSLSTYRVSVWSSDGYGHEKDFTSDREDQARELYDKIVGCNYISMAYLIELGMELV